MPSTSPTQRALAECRKRGWQSQVVEYWLAPARRRIDLFGCIDILALDGESGSLGIQVTSGSGHSARVKKSLAEPRIREWVRAGNRFEVWSYAKRGPVGKRKVWTLRVQRLELEQFEDQPNG